MLVVRFRIQCLPEKADLVAATLTDVVTPSRALPGVVSFDVCRDLTDPNALVATEVFEDRQALDRQQEQPEVGKALAVLGDALAAPPEATLFHVSFAEPHGG